jgi:hypothetical protein
MKAKLPCEVLYFYKSNRGMRKNEVILKIVDYIPEDQRAYLNKIKTLDFIKNSTNYFDKNNFDGHVTVSAFILDESFRKILLLHHI